MFNFKALSCIPFLTKMLSKLRAIILFGFLMQCWLALSAKDSKKNVVCYQGTWSTYRQSLGKYSVSDIDPFLCTHLMYAFLGIEESGELRIIDPYLDLEDNDGRGNIKKFNALKLQNPTLKTLAAVGGWNEGSKKFSIVAANADKRAVFVDSVVKFLQRHGFDGLDLDWEYPGQRHSTGNDDQRNYIALLKELKEGLDPFGFMLTAAVGSAEFSAEKSYNISEIVQYLDLINVMAYDLHGPWDAVVGFNAPLYGGYNDKTARDKQLNVDAIVRYWLESGAPSEKVILGVPFYGRSFTLEDVQQHTPGAPNIGRGLAGQYSMEPGVIGYNELCERMLYENWTTVWDEKQQVPYAYRERQWIAYESESSIALKANYVVKCELAGIMVWSLESDDFHGVCGNEPNPLLKQINLVLFGKETPTGLTSNLQHNETHANSQYTKEYVCKADVGYVRDPRNCSKFHLCESGTTYNFECPNSLKFDLTSESCNYADVVMC